MTLHDLQKYIDPPPHAQRSRYSPYARTEHRSRQTDAAVAPDSSTRLTLAEALRDPEVSAAALTEEDGRASFELAHEAEVMASAEDVGLGAEHEVTRTPPASIRRTEQLSYPPIPRAGSIEERLWAINAPGTGAGESDDGESEVICEIPFTQTSMAASPIHNIPPIPPPTSQTPPCTAFDPSAFSPSGRISTILITTPNHPDLANEDPTPPATLSYLAARARLARRSVRDNGVWNHTTNTWEPLPPLPDQSLNGRRTRMREMQRRLFEDERLRPRSRESGLRGAHSSFPPTREEAERMGSERYAHLLRLEQNRLVAELEAGTRSGSEEPAGIEDRSSSRFEADAQAGSAASANARAPTPAEREAALFCPDVGEEGKVTMAYFRFPPRNAAGQDSGHNVGIEFMPAVSGRFLLVKLWPERRLVDDEVANEDGGRGGDGNVDCRSLVAVGYSGPRFFGASEAR